MKVTRLCPSLCNPMDYTVHGILQARILEWVAAPFSRGSSQPGDRTQVSRIAGRFFTSWATRDGQEYWSGSLSFLQWIFPTRNWTGVSCIVGGFFTSWASREAGNHQSSIQFSSVTQSCPTLCNPMNCSTPGLPVHHQFPGVHTNSCASSRWCHPAI